MDEDLVRDLVQAVVDGGRPEQVLHEALTDTFDADIAEGVLASKSLFRRPLASTSDVAAALLAARGHLQEDVRFYTRPEVLEGLDYLIEYVVRVGGKR